MRHYLLPSVLALLLLSACKPQDQVQLLGTLEWDRISIPAESSEVILSWQVAEGDQVAANQLLLELDPRRQQARIAQANADLRQASAHLAELNQGPRSESIDAAQANLASSRADLTDAQANYQRIATLFSRAQVAIAERDNARAKRDQARAANQAADAQWRELNNGTRPEQLEQASALLAQAQARLTELQLNAEHLQVRAPRAGHIDALPFKVGDQPPVGAVVVSLLVGTQPYARVFIPASQRAQHQVGDSLQVRVEGIATPFPAIISSIQREASFTPYYALSGDDASQLAYRAELRLQGDDARRLPAGLPVQDEVSRHVQP